MVDFLQALAVAAEVIVCPSPKQGGFGKGSILPQRLISVLDRFLVLALIQKYFGPDIIGRVESRISLNHRVQAPLRRWRNRLFPAGFAHSLLGS